MTREEQIEQVAWKYDRENSSPGSEDYKVEGFIAGVKWADLHPDWHKYPEDPPHREDQYIIFTADKSYMTVDYLNGHFVTVIFGIYEELEDQDVVAWKELPEPPKFD